MPRRYLLLVGTFLLTMLLYVDRIAVSAGKEQIAGDLALDDTEFGWALSAFALGYALFQAPGGALADRFGPRRILASIVVLWSIFTVLTGLVWGLVSLLIFRFLFGLAEAGAMPACARVVYMWLPLQERGLAQGVNLSGTRIGGAIALPALAWLLTTIGWRETFAALGVIGLVWAIGWYLWFRDDPEQHGGVSEAERLHIMSGRGVSQTSSANSTVGTVVRSANLYMLMTQYFASNFTFFFCLTWLFPYLQRTYSLTAVETGLLAALPLLGGAFGNWTGGAGVDWLYRKGYALGSRRSFAVLGFALAAIGVGGCLAADDALSAVLWLTLAIFGADMTLPPSWALCIDLGGKSSGTVSGLMNMAGNIGSFVTALAFPYLLAFSGSTGPFFLTAMMLNVAGALLWLAIRRPGPTGAPS